MRNSLSSSFSGASASRQVVRTSALVNELVRLGCRFRQRSSHIVFHHDAAGVHGGIVSGTRKLWSQEVAALAQSRIEDFYRAQKNGPLLSSSSSSLPLKPRPETNPLLPVAGHLPENIFAEPAEGQDGIIVLRSRKYPQIGMPVQMYMRADDLDWSLSQIKNQESELADSVELLAQADFSVSREADGTVNIAHPALEIQATLHPFQPGQSLDAQDAINHLFEIISDAEANRVLLDVFIKSRKLAETARLIDGDIIKYTYGVRPFQGGFGRQVSFYASLGGFVDEKDLMKFMDEIDTHFFSEIDGMLRKKYGFRTEKNRQNCEMVAVHPLLESMAFSYPDFSRLPSLCGYSKKEAELGRAEYVKSLNDVISRREDLLELVSYGITLTLDQLYENADKFDFYMDFMDEFSGFIEKKNAGEPGKALKKKGPSLEQRTDFLQSVPTGKIFSLSFGIPDYDHKNINIDLLFFDLPNGNRVPIPTKKGLEEIESYVKALFQKEGLEIPQNPTPSELRLMLKDLFEGIAPSDPRSRQKAFFGGEPQALRI